MGDAIIDATLSEAGLDPCSASPAEVLEGGRVFDMGPSKTMVLGFDCDGSAAIKAGDQIPVDPDEIDDELLEPGEEKPTHVTAFVDQPLFTDAQIRECVADASARLRAAGRA